MGTLDFLLAADEGECRIFIERKASEESEALVVKFIPDFTDKAFLILLHDGSPRNVKQLALIMAVLNGLKECKKSLDPILVDWTNSEPLVVTRSTLRYNEAGDIEGLTSATYSAPGSYTEEEQKLCEYAKSICENAVKDAIGRI